MAGTYTPGQDPIRPGAYFHISNVGQAPAQGVPTGVVSVVAKASSGPLNTPTVIDSATAGHRIFGSALGAQIIDDLFNGGARQLQFVRPGTAGTAASYNAMDSAPAIGVVLAARSVGLDGSNLRFTIRDYAADPTALRELIVYSGTTPVETFRFAKAPASSPPAGFESDALVAAVAAATSDYITATRGVGAGPTLTAVTSVAPTVPGVDPTVTAGEYTAAFTALEPNTVFFNVLAIDSEVPAVQVSAAAFIDRVRAAGKLVRLVVGEPTTVSLATRLANAAAFNNPAVMYVGNGFVDSSGVPVEGYRAAARVAAMVAAKEYTASLTGRTLVGAQRVYNAVGELSSSQIEQAILKGMMVFSSNQAGQPKIEYGITSFNSLTGGLDAGWKKEKRVGIRDTVVMRLISVAETTGPVNNDPIGQAVMQSRFQGALTKMVSEGALGDGPRIGLDPAYQSVGDSQFWKAQVDDIDSGEKFMIDFGFRYAPAA